MATTTVIKLQELEKVVESFGIAENYFSDILAFQLAVFSIVILVLLGLYFFFNWKIQKDQIESEVKAGIEKLTDSLKKEVSEKFEGENKRIETQLTSDFVKHEGEIKILRAEIYRSMGQFWDSQKSYATAFLWWFRAACEFASTTDEKMTRISLESAKESLNKVPYSFHLTTQIIGEYQRLLPMVDDVKFGIEKELLKDTFKKVLAKDIKQNTGPTT